MNNKSAIIMNNKSTIGNIISWQFGILAFAIGVVNVFWGNDPFFGVLIVLLSFAFFPPTNIFLEKWTGLAIPVLVKIVLALFILWASLGVGELFDKIDLMIKDL